MTTADQTKDQDTKVTGTDTTQTNGDKIETVATRKVEVKQITSDTVQPEHTFKDPETGKKQFAFRGLSVGDKLDIPSGKYKIIGNGKAKIDGKSIEIKEPRLLEETKTGKKKFDGETMDFKGGKVEIETVFDSLVIVEV